MDVQPDVCQVVNVLGGHRPYYFADLTLGELPRHACERLGIDLFVPRQFCDVVQRSAVGFGERLLVGY